VTVRPQWGEEPVACIFFAEVGTWHRRRQEGRVGRRQAGCSNSWPTKDIEETGADDWGWEATRRERRPTKSDSF
jgi:hypothetical protein